MGGGQLVKTGIVLKKTKLGETDLIVTLVDEEGASLQAVAKGARKPNSSFSSRLDLFGCVQVFCAQGKGLPIVQDVRLVKSHVALRQDYEKTAAASVLAELAAKTIQEDLPVRRLFALCDTAFDHIEASEASSALAHTVAACLKLFALLGVRPSFATCVSCGVDALDRAQSDTWAFSYLEGGYLCEDCRSFVQAIPVESPYLMWLNALMMSAFKEVGEFQVPETVLSFGFHFVQEWSRAHFGANLKAIPFLLTSVSLPEDEPC